MAKQAHIGERTKPTDVCSGGSGSEDSSLSSSEEGSVPSPPQTDVAVAASSSEEDEDDILCNSPKQMSALTIHHQIHPKLNQLVERILSELERLKSKF